MERFEKYILVFYLLKDCFGGSLGKVGRGLSRTPGRPPSSRSGSSYYVGEVSSVRRTGGGNCEDCFEDLEEFCGCNMCSNDGGPCSRKRIGILVIFIWLFILTIICIVLGSNIGTLDFFIILFNFFTSIFLSGLNLRSVTI